MEKQCPIDEALRLIETGDHKRALKSLLSCIAQDPSNFQAYNALGTLYVESQPKRALRCFQRSLELNPNYPLALYNIANLLKAEGRVKEAVSLYNEALKIDPNLFQAYFNIGNILIESFDYEEAQKYLQRAISIEPDFVKALSNLGVCYFHLGNISEAINCHERAIKKDPNFADAHFNLALSLLMDGNYIKGWDEYRWRWKSSQFKPVNYKKPLWDGSDISGKRLLVFSEQGYGDTIQFVRYLKLILSKGINLLFQCPPALKDLIYSSFVQNNICIIDNNPSSTEYDLCCPLMELPFFFNTTLETIPLNIPYLTPDNRLIHKYSCLLNKASSERSDTFLKVGIAWRGSRANHRGQYRSMSLRDIAPLLMNKDVLFVSLMKEYAIELEGLEIAMLDMSKELIDFHETAALIANLDLVITIDTAVAHLAGAMGKPVWLMLHHTSDWRWMLHRTDSPWYPTMKIFRQNTKDNWDNVIEDITKELSLLAAIEIPDNKKGFYDQKITLPASPTQKGVSETEAMDYYRNIIETNPLNAQAHWELALLLLKNGNFDEGWREYEWRKRLPQCVDYYPNLPIPEWRGEDLSGKSILLYDEQGFGDVIQFVRFVYKLNTKKGSVKLLCRPELSRLMRTLEGSIEIYEKGVDFTVKVDYITSLMSLPFYLKIGIEDMAPINPYFHIPQKDINRWKDRMDPDPSVLNLGLAWGGRTSHLHNNLRSMNFNNMLPLLELPGVAFYSLQKHDNTTDISDYDIRDCTSEFRDFYDTACFISNLDLVITVDTAVAHLAGALGKETWLMLPFNAEWRWFKDEHRTLWYPTMRLFRQSTPGDWQGVIDRIINNIKVLKG